jgi:hypothetical protein
MISNTDPSRRDGTPDVADARMGCGGEGVQYDDV